MNRILIIDNYDSFTYNLYQATAQIYPKIDVVRNDKITLQEIQKMSLLGIILSPGPGRPENAGICIPLIQAIMNGDMAPTIPLLGVCLGHQAITVALGGKVIQSGEIFHGKSDFIFHCRNNLYKKLCCPFQAGRYHSLISEKSTLPHELIVDAVNYKGVVMGIRHINLPIYGVQFHPESVLTPEGNLLLDEFVQICKLNTTYKIAQLEV